LNLSQKKSFLDIACGPGHLAVAAVDQGCKATGLDFSAEMINSARQLYPAITFEEGDAQNLSFKDKQFDAAGMNFGILHLDQPDRAVNEVYRVLQSNGTFAATVWDKSDVAVAFSVVLQAVEKYGNTNVPLPPGPPFFKFSDPHEFEQLLARAGFAKITIQKIPMQWHLPKPEELFKAFFYGTPRTGGLLRAQTQVALKDIESAVSTQARKYTSDQGIVVPMGCLLATGHRLP
jgi:SAM-dependent methyltransferase